MIPKKIGLIRSIHHYLQAPKALSRGESKLWIKAFRQT